MTFRLSYRIAILGVLAFQLSPTTHAQEIDLDQHVQSAVPAESRFEFVQSTIAARHTFKIDKFTGRVFQLVAAQDGGVSWDSILRLDHVLDLDISKDRPNYQLFSSGLAAKYTFLMNVNSGATWQLVKDSESDDLVWSPFL